MIILFVLLPLVVIARESSKLSQLHDGDAIVRTRIHSVDNAVDVLPSYAYHAEPNFKFRYANYMRKNDPPAASGLPSSETGVNNRSDKKGPPHISTPYFLPNFTAGTPLFEGYRMLLANEQLKLKIRPVEKKTSKLNYADYRSIEKLLTQITSQKIPKTAEYI